MKNYFTNYNLTYDAKDLLDAFNAAPKKSLRSNEQEADLPKGFASTAAFSVFFERFPFISQDDNNLSIIKLNSDQYPHIDSGTNALIIFLLSGDLSLNTYSYVSTTKDQNGRPEFNGRQATPTLLSQVKSTLVDTYQIPQRPTYIDSSTVYSLNTTNGAIYMVLKVPTSVSWDEMQAFSNIEQIN